MNHDKREPSSLLYGDPSVWNFPLSRTASHTDGYRCDITLVIINIIVISQQWQGC